jgi:hypothetical protein
VGRWRRVANGVDDTDHERLVLDEPAAPRTFRFYDPTFLPQLFQIMSARADDLGRLTVLDDHGSAVTVGSLWAARTAVLVFVRHFG